MGTHSGKDRIDDGSSESEGGSAPPAVLRLHHADDLVEAVPYLIGFRPRDSVVLVGIEAGARGSASLGGRVRITVRMDIADLCAGAPASGASGRGATSGRTGSGETGFGAVTPADTDEGVRRAAIAIRRSGATAVVGLLYVDSEVSAHLSEEASRRAADACAAVGLELGDLVVVAGPHPGESVPSTTSQIAAEATYAGLVALNERGDLLERLEAEPATCRARLRHDLDAEEARVGGFDQDGRRRRRSAIRALFAATRTLAVLDDDQLVRFGAALTTNEVRDACWLAMEAARIDGEALWRELARRLPAPYDAAPLFLFGWQRWRGGDGVLAGMAARRALDSDPSYSAANLLDIAITDGLDPFRTPRLRKGA